MVRKMEKRCEVCGMSRLEQASVGIPSGEAKPDLKREFEGETYYFHTGLCMITFDIQLEKIIAEWNRLLEESRRSLGLSMLHSTPQLNEAVMAHRDRSPECACEPLSQSESYNNFQMKSGGYNDNV